MILNRDHILSASDTSRVLVACPEWGGDVYVRVLTNGERETYEAFASYIRETGGDAATLTLNSGLGYRTALVILTACDELGQAIFQPDDLATLGQKSSIVIKRIFDAAWALNHFGDEPELVELAEKNSDSAHGSSFGSA